MCRHCSIYADDDLLLARSCADQDGEYDLSSGWGGRELWVKHR